MRVVALNGSPRKGGNTDILIDEFLRRVREAGAAGEKIYLYDYTINPVGELSDRHSRRVDVHASDDHRLILNRVMDADILVLASPVYWQGVSCQMKCFVDRFSVHYVQPWFKEGMANKGWVVLTPFGAPDLSEADWIIKPVKVWVDHFSGKYLGEVAVSVFQKGDVVKHPEATQAAYELGKSAVEQMGVG